MMSTRKYSSLHQPAFDKRHGAIHYIHRGTTTAVYRMLLPHRFSLARSE